jgi:hypothetical protein
LYGVDILQYFNELFIEQMFATLESGLQDEKVRSEGISLPAQLTKSVMVDLTI